MICDNVQAVMDLVLADDPGLTPEMYEAFLDHLAVCQACSLEYEQSKALIGVLRQFTSLSQDTVELLESHGHEVAPHLRANTSPAHGGQLFIAQSDTKSSDVCSRRQEASAEPHRWRLRHIGIAAALAACVLLCVTLALMNFGAKSTNRDHGSLASESDRSYFIESVTRSGGLSIELGKPVESRNQRQDLLLGGMHRVVMNANTVATFHAGHAPDSYQVDLMRGELYVEVVPGHAFEVRTPHARLEITGTKFNVRAIAAHDRTDLALLKGSVRFSSLTGGEAVDVVAGHASSVMHGQLPSSPRSVDADVVTAWAREQESQTDRILALDTSYEPWLLDASELQLGCLDFLVFQTTPLEDIVYINWIQENKEWLDGNYRWLFDLQKALVKDGVQVRYDEIFIQAGDFWQFDYGGDIYPVIFAKPEFKTLLKVAQSYGFDKKWLLENVSVASSLPQDEKIDFQSRGHRLKNLKQWLKHIEAGTNTHLYSFKAASYLSKARIFAWLVINENKIKTKNAADKKSMLENLKQQIELANNLKVHLIYAADKPNGSKCMKKPERTKEIIQSLIDIEGELVSNE